MKQIIVDPENSHLLTQHKWRIYSRGYVTAYINGSTVCLHHLVAGFPPSGKETDHINRNKLDNRKVNLRHITHQENLLNRDFENKSGYRGVYFDKTNRRSRPYKAMVRRNGKSVNLGYYASPVEASEVVK